MQKKLEAFAHLSGDYNPIHLDGKFAEDSYFGTQIIYGIYQVFHLMEKAFSNHKPSPAYFLTEIKATFSQPLGIDAFKHIKIKGSWKKESSSKVPKTSPNKQKSHKNEIIKQEASKREISMGSLAIAIG